MISKKLADAINVQMNFELESGYIYKAMEAFFGCAGYSGFQHFMKLQAEEEYDHHQLFANFLYEANQDVTYTALPEPQKKYESEEEVFKAALAHEQEVTKRINHLYEIALEEKDYSALPTLHWFIAEQVEEEDTFRGILDVFENSGGNKAAILQLDKKLGMREE